MKLGILFGSSSNEHEVSIASACSLIKNLDKNKYDITPIYLDKENNFYRWNTDINSIEIKEVGFIPTSIEKIDNVIDYLKLFDKIFIMVHGKNGEDGTISSILDFLKIKYIGHDNFSSVTTMDKILTKLILKESGIKTSPFIYFTKYNNKYIIKDLEFNYNELLEYINKNIKYPLFIKPSNSGSSIGISKVTNKDELDEKILEALKIDNRILIEEMIVGRELECAILERNNEVIATLPGEIISNSSFYSFKAKYKSNASKTITNPKIEEEIALKCQKLASNIFKILNLHTYSRCDFFLTNNNEIIFNEINTIPGFTEISMYPKLIENIGISYKDLLDILISS